MEKAALIIIDMQKGLFKKERGIFNESSLLNNINKLIKKQKSTNLPIIFTQHNNNQLKQGTAKWEIHESLIINKDDFVIQKTKGDAFIDTELNNILLKNKVKKIIVLGLVSNGCVKATCIGGLKNSYKVVLVKDAHSSWSKDAMSIIEKVNLSMAEKNIELLETSKFL